MLHILLHNAHIITKCHNRYYKMHNLLLNASLLQNAAEYVISWQSRLLAATVYLFLLIQT